MVKRDISKEMTGKLKWPLGVLNRKKMMMI